MAKNKSRKITPISDTQAAIGAGAIILFFVIWALIAGVGNDFVNWIGGKSNLSGWVQAIGSIATIWVAFFTIQYQRKEERRRMRASASALVNTLGGALGALKFKLPADGNRSAWDVAMMRTLLAAEMDRANTIPMVDLSPDEQRGVFAFRLAGFQLIEAFNYVENEIEEIDGSQFLTKEAYGFFIKVISDAEDAIQEGQKLLGSHFF